MALPAKPSYLIGGTFNSVAPILIDGDLSPFQLDASGNLKVNVVVGGGSSSVAITSPVDGSGYVEVDLKTPLPAGTNVIGHVIVDSGSLAVTQITSPWVVQDLADVPGGGTTPPNQVLMVGGKTNDSISFFSHVQGRTGNIIAGDVLTATLSTAPIQGNLVCVAITAIPGSSLTLSTVKDANGNSYTVTPSSPSNAQSASAGETWLAYLLSAPTNASATVQATFTTAPPVGSRMYIDEFSVTGGVQVFDKDAVGSGTAGTTINTPTIVPAFASELLYAAVSLAQTITAAGSPWTLGFGFSGTGNEYDLSSSSSTPVNFSQNFSGAWDSMAMAFYISGPATGLYDIMPLGTGGRSVIVEGFPGGVPVSTSDNLVQIAGNAVATAASGVQKVGIVGNTGATLDGVITAATAPARGLATLVVNNTTSPSLTTGQSVAAQADYVGNLFVKPYRRSQTVSQATTIASSSSATTILAAQAAGIFADISKLIITVTPAAVTAIQFTATLSDGTNSYVFDLDTGVTAATGAEGVDLDLDFNPPLPATTAATAWTLTLSVATVTVNVTVVAVKQKAS